MSQSPEVWRPKEEVRTPPTLSIIDQVIAARREEQARQVRIAEGKTKLTEQMPLVRRVVNSLPSGDVLALLPSPEGPIMADISFTRYPRRRRAPLDLTISIDEIGETFFLEDGKLYLQTHRTEQHQVGMFGPPEISDVNRYLKVLEMIDSGEVILQPLERSKDS